MYICTNRIYLFTGDACDRGIEEMQGYGAIINVFVLLANQAFAKIYPKKASIFYTRGNHDTSEFISSRAGGALWHAKLKELTK